VCVSIIMWYSNTFYFPLPVSLSSNLSVSLLLKVSLLSLSLSPMFSPRLSPPIPSPSHLGDVGRCDGDVGGHLPGLPRVPVVRDDGRDLAGTRAAHGTHEEEELKPCRG